MDSIALGDILTSASILVVLVTFVFGYLEKRSSERRRRTFNFLMTIKEEGGVIQQAALEFSIWIRNNRVVEVDNIDADDDKTIITLIDFYDLLSNSAIRGVIDQEVLILHLGGAMRSAYKMTQKYIEARRDALNRPGLYQSFEKFVTERIRDREV